MRKIRRHTQLKLTNPRGAGRKALHDKGIRHTEREVLRGETVLHLTLKINRDKAALKNKNILKVLQNSIMKARLIGLNVIQYTLEYDHIHLLVEAHDNSLLAKGMQSLTIRFSKGINKLKGLKGSVFKTRYHFRKLETPREIKNALNYVLGNGIKHKDAASVLNPYNSLVSMPHFKNLYPGFEIMIEDIIRKSPHLLNLKGSLKDVLSIPRNYHLKKLCGFP